MVNWLTMSDRKERDTVLVRLKQSLHKSAKIAAIEDNKTLEDWLSDLVNEELTRREKTE